jgi:hypothetical protein
VASVKMRDDIECMSQNATRRAADHRALERRWTEGEAGFPAEGEVDPAKAAAHREAAEHIEADARDLVVLLGWAQDGASDRLLRDLGFDPARFATYRGPWRLERAG